MSDNHCTCTSSYTTHESITENGKTIEKTTKVDKNVGPDGKIHTTTTVTTVDPEGHKTVTTNSSTGGAAPAVDFNHDDDFDAEFDRMKAKMDADMRDFTNDHPALK